MMINPNVELLFIDYDPRYMKIVKDLLEQGRRFPGEKIHLARSLADAHMILRERDAIESISLHIQPDKSAIKRALTKLRRMSLAEIIVIAMFEDEEDISELYNFGMNMLVPPIYQPPMAVAYYESFFERHRLPSGIHSMKAVEQVKDNVKMQCGELTIDPVRHLVGRGGVKIDLTALEFDLLCFMARHEGMLLTHDMLTRHVWNFRHVSIHSISNRIHSLRKKIEPDPGDPCYIITKYGVGYKFVSKQDG